VNALSQFLGRRPHGSRHGAPETPMPANAAPLLNAPVSLPPLAPTFTPTARHLASTQPFTAASPAVRGTHARTAPRHVQQDDGTLRRVLDALRDLPAAPLSRADQFTADMRAPRKGGLPVFRAVAHAVGWCGLDGDPAPVMAPGQRSLAAWHQEARDAIDARFAEAQAEIRHVLAERDRRESRIRAAADAALALGYPGGTL
jgi:hypothetical protein